MAQQQKRSKIILVNKKLHFRYIVIEEMEAGLVLFGNEVKSILNHNANIEDAYVHFRHNEAYLLNMHIAPFAFGNIHNPDPLRTKKLLLHKKQIIRLQLAIKKQQITMVVGNLHWFNNKIKAQLCLVQGKKMHDKRQTIKERDLRREHKIYY